MESDGRRRLKKLHCMKCGQALVQRTTAVPPEHVPASLASVTPATLTRSVCPDAACGWVHYNNPLPVVAAVVEMRGENGQREILLVRGKGWPKSWFGLVTGFLEGKEDPTHGVLREVKEELGLESRVVDFLGVFPFKRANQLLLAYHVIAERAPVVLQAEEIEAYKAVPLNQLRPWAEGTGPAVREFLRRQLGESPPDSETAFSRKNLRIDKATGAIVEILPAKL